MNASQLKLKEFVDCLTQLQNDKDFYKKEYESLHRTIIHLVLLQDGSVEFSNKYTKAGILSKIQDNVSLVINSSGIELMWRDTEKYITKEEANDMVYFKD